MKQILFIIILFHLLFIIDVNAQFWSLSGNAGANPTTRFLGTLDDQPLMFKVNNEKSGYLDYYFGNVSYGYLSALSVTSGINNTSKGFYSFGAYNNSSSFNTSNGSAALFFNKLGNNNIAIGSHSLYYSDGNNNIAIGNNSLYYNGDNSNDNIAIGNNALYNNSTGYSNLAIGTDSQKEAYQGYYNTSIGYSSLKKNAFGYSNTAMGHTSLYYDRSGNSNTAFGYSSLHVLDGGTENVAVGQFSLYNSITGQSNTAIGNESLYSNGYGYGNTAIGNGSIYAINNGSLFSNIDGYNNTAIGMGTDVAGTAFYGSTAIGESTQITANLQIRFGNSLVNDIGSGGFASWTNFSDGRFKRNIKENVPGLEFIKLLNPVTYYYDDFRIKKLQNQIPNTTQPKKTTFKDLKNIVMLAPSVKTQEDQLHFGFIAQEVYAAAQKVNYNFSGVDKAKNKSDFWGLRYAEFVVPIVKAIQELDISNNQLKEKIHVANEKYKLLKEKYLSLKSLIDEIPKQ